MIPDMENKQGKPYDYPSLMPRESFQVMSKERGIQEKTQTKPKMQPEWRTQEWESEKAKEPSVHDSKPQIGENICKPFIQQRTYT